MSVQKNFGSLGYYRFLPVRMQILTEVLQDALICYC